MSTEPAIPSRRRGFTLIEIVITLIVVSIAIAAIAGMVANLAGASADPVIQTQAIYIAEGYLEEAGLRPLDDPDGVEEGCAASRALWDDLDDYACLATPSAPTDAYGNALDLLSSYRVSMTVDPPALIDGISTRRVEARVSHVDGSVDIRLATYRASY